MDWRSQGDCVGNADPEAWFDAYENNQDLRPAVDRVCMNCPVQRTCFASGVSSKEWGVWGGVYLVDGKPDTEFNNHRSREDWTELWQSLTIEA